MKEIKRQLIMLKPMRAGVNGYARLESERGKTLIQINVRGMKDGSMRAFWYCSGGETRELGQATANVRGEAALTAEAPAERVAPERLQALLLLDGAEEPRPLMIGLCAAQSAGSLLDAKNASLSLCQRLQRQQRQKEAEARPREEDSSPASGRQKARLRRGEGDNGGDGQRGTAGESRETHPAEAALPSIVQPNADDDLARHDRQEPPKPLTASPDHPQEAYGLSPEKTRRSDDPPREIFLPAIDPTPYAEAYMVRESAPEACETEPAQKKATAPPLRQPPPNAVPVDGLAPLRWPEAFLPLKEYFERLMPCSLLGLPGWRFVCVSQEGDGLWIGYLARDNAVRQVAYAFRGEPPKGDRRPYETRRGLDGALYRVLVQRAG